jgi:thiamine pyrophosphate-dependent acetolactate synthase large subunit-like protein
MLVYEAIGETLKRLGVNTVFGLMGDGNMRYISYMDETLGLRFYGSRHENSAVAMADGYYRVSNQAAVSTVTEGPGITNAMTALCEAVKASSPILLLAGDTPTGALRHNQDIDQKAVFDSIGVGVQRLRAPETIVPDLVRAWNRVLREQRPVAMSIPVDWHARSCPEESLNAVSAQPVPPVRPADAGIKALAQIVAGAKLPLIVAGRGATRCGARNALVALGDRIGAIFATSVQAKGFFSGHRYDTGVSGGFVSPAAIPLLTKADLVIAFGTSLGPWITRNGELLSPAAKIVHVDSKAAAVGALMAIDFGLCGDVAATAEALNQELDLMQVKLPGFRSPWFDGDIDALHRPAEFDDQSTDKSVDPRSVMRRLENLLPAARTVVVDSGHAMGWATQWLSVPDAQGFIFSNDFQAVGLGLATAIGAAIARPERLTVCTPGDGGFMMNLGELETVVRYNIPMLIVVLNDAAYGVEVHILRAWHQSPKHAFFSDVDCAAIARAMGAGGITVRKPSDLDGLKGWLSAPKGPMLLDCKLNIDIMGDWFRENLSPDSWLARMSRH